MGLGGGVVVVVELWFLVTYIILIVLWVGAMYVLLTIESVYWVIQILPQICTVILRIFVGKVA